MYNKDQIYDYLERINYYGDLCLTYETLAKIQACHLENIPYENIDLIHGKPLSLKEEDLFKKLVTEKRGGYCFEQNGLLFFVLKSLGFNVKQFCGRFIDGKPEEIQERRHRVLLVELEKEKVICDVGVYGEAPRKPLRLIEDEIQNDGICEYRYKKDNFYGWITCQKQQGKQWRETYGFTEEEWLSEDFMQPSFFCEKHPDSIFNKFYKIGIYRGKESLTLIDHCFTIYADAMVQQTIQLSDEQVGTALEDYFGITL